MTESRLAYIAEQPMDEHASWQQAPHLGRVAMRYLQGCNPLRIETCYRFDGADELLCGVSEQPDLTGPVLLELSLCQGRWVQERAKAHSYDYMRNSPPVIGRYIGFHVEHEQTAERLLGLAVPLTKKVAAALRYGYSAESSTPAYSACRILERYNADDIDFEPRRRQVAAALLRHIKEQKVPRSVRYTPEELADIREEYFVQKEVPLTGGGGKTSLQWVYRQ